MERVALPSSSSPNRQLGGLPQGTCPGGGVGHSSAGAHMSGKKFPGHVVLSPFCYNLEQAKHLLFAGDASGR